MKAKRKNASPEHTGSTFDSFLEEEGLREEVESVAVSRVRAWQLETPPRRRSKVKGHAFRRAAKGR